MEKKILCVMAFLLMLSCSTVYADMSLTIEPLQQTIGAGETAEVGIILSGLVDDPELTEFWIEVFYDDTILSFGGGTTGVEAEETNFDSGHSGSVYIEVLDISRNPQSYPEWTVATLTFSGEETGTSLLELNTLAGFLNDNGELTITTFNNSAITVVPIPGSFVLLLSSLGLIGLVRRFKEQ